MKGNPCSCYGVFLSRCLCVYLRFCVESQLSSDALVQHWPTLHLTASQYNRYSAVSAGGYNPTLVVSESAGVQSLALNLRLQVCTQGVYKQYVIASPRCHAP